jgi:hypothetical protein
LLAQSNRAFVAFLDGKAEFAAGPKGPWKRLNLKQVIPDSYYVRTKDGTKMMLRYRGVDVRLVGKSEMQIVSLSSGKDAKLKLNRGFAWVDLKEKRKFSVTTPTSIASVRGTKFAVAADEDGSVSCVCEGKVATENIKDGKSRLMKPGGSHTFGSDGKFRNKNLNKYFRKLKVDVTFKREIRKEAKYSGCLSCHKMVNLKQDSSSDEFGEEYW